MAIPFRRAQNFVPDLKIFNALKNRTLLKSRIPMSSESEITKMRFQTETLKSPCIGLRFQRRYVIGRERHLASISLKTLLSCYIPENALSDRHDGPAFWIFSGFTDKG